LYLLSATQRCAQPNLHMFNIPQNISLATDVTLSYTETHRRPKITASNQSWSDLIAPFSVVYIVSVESFFFALHAQFFFICSLERNKSASCKCSYSEILFDTKLQERREYFRLKYHLFQWGWVETPSFYTGN